MKQDIDRLKVGDAGDIFKEAQNIVEQTRNYAYQAVNVAMVQLNWLLGKLIADEELKGGESCRVWQGNYQTTCRLPY